MNELDMNNLIEQMNSGYRPIQKEAINNYINLGGNSYELLKYITISDRTTNLLQVYVALSAKEGKRAVENAWNFIRELVFSTYFDSNYHFIGKDNSDYSYIFQKFSDSIIEYLLSQEYLDIFINEMIITQRKASEFREDILNKINMSCENSHEYQKYNSILDIRYLIDRCKGREIYSVMPDERLLDKWEINIAKYISIFPGISKFGNNNILNYQYFLKYIILDKVTYKSKNSDNLLKKLDEKCLFNIIGYDYLFSSSIKYNLTPYSSINVLDKLRQNKDIDLFQKDFYNIKKYILEQYKSVDKNYNEINAHIYEFTRKWYFFTEDYCDMLYLIIECNTIQLCEQILDELFDLMLLKYNDEQHYKNKKLDFYIKYMFDDEIIKDKYPYHILMNALYREDYSLETLENIFLKYLDEKVFFSDNNRKLYYSIGILLEHSSNIAYDFIKRIINDKRYSIEKEEYYSIPFYCRMYFSHTEVNKWWTSLKIEIGLMWEKLCQEIAYALFPKVLTNHCKEARLTNGKKPDIVYGEDKCYDNGMLKHTPVIIECKRSVNFADFDSIGCNEYVDLINNKTVYKYIDYCDELQFWILKKPSDFKYPEFKKIKFVFAEDLIINYNLSNEFKIKVQDIVDASYKWDNFNIQEATVKKIIDLIDYFEMYEKEAFELRKNKEKSIKENNIVKVIRQYNLDGSFVKEYDSVSTASKMLNISSNSICNAAGGRKVSAGGYLWNRCLEGEPIVNIVPPKKIDITNKTIYQIDFQGTVVKEYKTIASAAKAVGIDRKGIRDTICGRQKTAGGYYWRVD